MKARPTMQGAVSLNHFLIRRLSWVLMAWLLVCLLVLGLLGQQAVQSEYQNAQELVGFLHQELLSRQPLGEAGLAQIQAGLAQSKAKLEQQEILIEIVVVALILAAMGLSAGLVLWFGLKRQLMRPLSHLVNWLEGYEEDVRKGKSLHDNMPNSNVAELKAMHYGIEKLIQTLELEQTRRKELISQMIQVQETERQTIAQDLHDHLGQMLTSISVNSAALCKRTTGAMNETAQAIQASTQDMMTWLRGSLKELKPHVLLEVSLKEAALDLTENWAKRRGWFVDFAWADEASQLPENQGIQVFRILQEALTNAAKHSTEKRVKVLAGLTPETHDFVMVVENECGEASDTPAISLGLAGARDRAEAIGGELSWNIQAGKFVLLLNLPKTAIDAKRPAEADKPNSQRDKSAP